MYCSYNAGQRVGTVSSFPPSLTQCWSFEIKLQNSGTLGVCVWGGGGGGGGSHSSEFGGYFQLVFVNTSGFHVRPTN